MHAFPARSVCRHRGLARRRAWSLLPLLLLGTAMGSSAQALATVKVADDSAVTDGTRYVLGLALKSSPEYPGSDRQAFKLRPLWALSHGRFTLSTSGASAVLGFAAAPSGSGLSAVLHQDAHWRVGASLRMDSGRASADSSHLGGLPDLRPTLRGRLYASYALAPGWSLGASLAQDLLGRQGGADLGLSLGWQRWLDPSTSIGAGAATSLGSARYMQSYFGVDPAHAVASGLPAFKPGAGIKSVGVGVGVMTLLSPRWVGFANVSAGTLLGQAADSPVTHRPAAFGLTLGLAYRCCL